MAVGAGSSRWANAQRRAAARLLCPERCGDVVEFRFAN